VIAGHSTITTLLYISVVAMTVYSGVLVMYVVFMLWVANRESRLRRRQSDVDDYDVVRGSRYTIPVSIIAPTFNEEVMAAPAINSLLALSYPELEVIVVDDGSTDGTLAALDREFDLEARQVFFRNSLTSKPVRTVYKSRKEPRLTVVSKENGGKADALNSGINFARYRYLCCVDGDTVFARDALLKAMSLVAKDPARIVAVSSLFGISLEPEASVHSNHTRPRTTGHLLGDFQHLDLMRSFVAYRLAWSRLECMLCVSGAFGIWRRDVILEMGGFSPAFTCEDIEMTFRIHEKFLREERPYRILSLPHMVAQTEGPNNIRSLISQRARWQRVTLETIWHYRGMMGRSCYRAAGLIGLPYYLLFECLAPVFQVLSLVTLVIAIVMGVLHWPAYLAFLGITVFGTAIPTTVAVLLHDAGFRDYRMRDLLRMIGLGPFDLLLYRPILVYAGLRGCWEFLRREKGWNKFDRNVRSSGRAAAVATSVLVLFAAPSARAQARDTVLQATRLAQTGRPRQAADLLEQRLSSNPDDVDALVALATALRQLNRKGEALAVIGRAKARAPSREDVARLERQLRQEVHGAEALITDNYENWNDGRGPWNETQLAVRQNTDAGPVIVRFSHATRVGLRDDRLEAEAYPRVGTGYLALGAGYATNTALYARSSVTAEFFESFSGGLEGSLGYRRLNFVDAVNVVTASGGMYAGDFLFGARANHFAGGASGTSVTLSGRRYFGDGVQYAGVQVSAGTARDDIRTQADIGALSSRAVSGDALILVRERWLIMPRAEVGFDDTHSQKGVRRSAVGLGLGVRF
jgi:biofilm PGA synthesis N-glycosyltransferase PgaC